MLPHLYIFKYLLAVGDFTLPGGRGSIRCPRECTTLRVLGFSLNVTAEWSTIFKHALKICLICLGFCCKTSCKTRSKNLIPDIDHHQLSTKLVVHPPRWRTLDEFHTEV